MMNRWVIDLGIARDEEATAIDSLKYMYVGDCDGNVLIKIGSRSMSPLNPEEFDKLTDIGHAKFMYVTNTAQAGKVLVLYVEEKTGLWR